MEVDGVKRFFLELSALELPAKYDQVKRIPIRELAWGRECFLHIPQALYGILASLIQSAIPYLFCEPQLHRVLKTKAEIAA
jgi:hypothetical protein